MGGRRILLVIPSLAPGGAETQLAHLAAGLARRGDRVTLAVEGRVSVDAGPLREAGVRVVAFGADGPRGKAGRLPVLARLAHRADVVHCGLWDASLYGRLAALATQTPVTVGEHSSDRSMQRSLSGASRARAIALHHRLLGRLTYATVACARSQVELLVGEGVPRERIVLIPNGVPVAALRAAAHAGHARDELGLPHDALVVIHVGRLTPEKHQVASLDAVAALRAELGDVRLLLVGDGDDPAPRARARELGAEGWATFLGARGDVPALLAAADLALLPSRVEALPMAMLEAMAIGVPQVVTDVGDLGTTLSAAGAGVVVPREDPGALLHACRRLLTDPGLRAELGAAGLAAAAEWDVEAMVEAYAAVFAGAAAGRPLRATGVQGADARRP